MIEGEREEGPKPTEVYHDPGKPEDYAGDPVPDGWQDPAKRAEREGMKDGKLGTRSLPADPPR